MTEADLLLGLDIGTQGAKGVLVNRAGEVQAQAQVEHDCEYPQPGWAEHDMLANWWEHPAEVVRRLLESPGITPARVAAVNVSGLYPAMGATDAEGQPLAGAILYSDNRALAEVEEVNRAFGLKLTSEELTPKLMWFLRNRPDQARRLRMFFDAAHYAVYRLTGAYVADTITLGLWGAIYSAPRAAWRPEVCARLGIPIDILPAIHPPAMIVGNVHAPAAIATGLKEGTPVLTGMPDLVASIISAGATSPDEAVAYYGTAGVVPVQLDDLLRAMRHPFPDEDGYLFYYAAYSLAVGDAVKWFRDVFGQPEVEAARLGGPGAYARLDALASETPAGADGLFLLPYFQGQRSPEFDPQASAVYFGMTPAHGRGHYFRAGARFVGLLHPRWTGDQLPGRFSDPPDGCHGWRSAERPVEAGGQRYHRAAAVVRGRIRRSARGGVRRRAGARVVRGFRTAAAELGPQRGDDPAKSSDTRSV